MADDFGKPYAIYNAGTIFSAEGGPREIVYTIWKYRGPLYIQELPEDEQLEVIKQYAILEGLSEEALAVLDLLQLHFNKQYFIDCTMEIQGELGRIGLDLLRHTQIVETDINFSDK